MRKQRLNSGNLIEFRLRAMVSSVLAVGIVSFAMCSVATANDDPPSLTVEGYFDKISYAPGEEFVLHGSTTANVVSVEISRVGVEVQQVFTKKDLPGKHAEIPEHASSHGCQWPELLRMKIPDEWRSGYYAVKLRVTDQGGKFVGRNFRTAEASAFLIVRPKQPGANARILMHLTTNTYNAYNNWGGGSLYGFHGRANLQGHRVSFNRPLAGFFDNWERSFVAWAERNGYAIDFCANSDLEFHPELLAGYKLVLAVGHDEYWSAPMRDHLEKYIAAGGNYASFSGNTCCWQVRSEEDGRALTCWKQNYTMDPQYQTGDYETLSSLWGHHLVNRPENKLLGVGFLHGGYHLSHGQFMDGKGAYTVQRPDHWVFAGTNLKRDDEFGAKNTIVGYETDGCELEWRDGLPFPTHRDGTPDSFTVLATCPVRWHPDDCEWYERWEKGRTGTACLGVYTQGGTVFTASTTDWSHGLRGDDPVVETITRNVLDRLSGK